MKFDGQPHDDRHRRRGQDHAHRGNLRADFFEAKTFFADWRDEIVAEHMGWMVPDHYDPATGFLKLSIHSWLLEIGGKKILIDTCVGNHKSRKHRPFWEISTRPISSASRRPARSRKTSTW